MRKIVSKVKMFVSKWYHSALNAKKFPKYRIIYTKGKYFAQVLPRQMYEWNENYIDGDGSTTWSISSHVDKYCAFDTKIDAVKALEAYILKKKLEEFNKVKVIDVIIK